MPDDEPSTSSSPDPQTTTSLGELAGLFLRLGTTAFGGPAAHIALMHDEVVVRRGWMDDQEYLDLVAASNLVPGPNSTEVAIHIGHRRAGWPGLLVAGACFILPAALIVGVLAWAYAEHGTDPAVVDLRWGILPVIVAIVGQALWKLARTAVRDVTFGLIAAGAAAAFLLDVGEVLVLVVAGALAVLWRRRHLLRRPTGPALVLPWAVLGNPTSTVVLGTQEPVELTRLFLVFLKIGAVLYGSGYVLIAFLETDLVDRLGWLTEQQLLDAIAIGQVT
ncbi:chromate transporter, partial [cyanobacterium TDX16]